MKYYLISENELKELFRLANSYQFLGYMYPKNKAIKNTLKSKKPVEVIAMGQVIIYKRGGYSRITIGNEDIVLRFRNLVDKSGKLIFIEDKE